jgi:hypothetical protein
VGRRRPDARYGGEHDGGEHRHDVRPVAGGRRPGGWSARSPGSWTTPGTSGTTWSRGGRGSWGSSYCSCRRRRRPSTPGRTTPTGPRPASG